MFVPCLPHKKYTNQLLLGSALCPGSPTWALGPRISAFTPQLPKTCRDPSCDAGTAVHSLAHTQTGQPDPPALAVLPAHANALLLHTPPRRCWDSPSWPVPRPLRTKHHQRMGTGSPGPAVSPSTDEAIHASKPQLGLQALTPLVRASPSCPALKRTQSRSPEEPSKSHPHQRYCR